MPTIAEELAALSPEQRKLLELELQEQGIEVEQLQITPRVEKREHYPVSYAQERLWFLAQLDPESSANHIPTPMQLSGNLSVPALRRAVVALVERHEALRTVFDTREGAPVQVVREQFRQPVPVIDLTALRAELRSAAQRFLTVQASSRPFDLASDPLLRTILVRAAPDQHALLLVMHHIVSDGWSMGLFYRELWAL